MHGADGADYEARHAALTEFAGWKALRTPHYRYLIHDKGHECLWDLQHDPGEYHNVAAEAAYLPVLSQHRKLMLQRLLQAERPLPRQWAY